MVMVMVAVLLPGPGSAPSFGRQVSPAGPDRVSTVPDPGKPVARAGEGRGEGVTSLHPLAVPAASPTPTMESVPAAAPRGGDAPRPTCCTTPSPVRALRSEPRAVSPVSPPGAQRHLSVVSTAYSYGCGGGSTTASGAPVAVGVVAMNMLPLGSTVRIVSGSFAGAVETVLDRIGWGTQLDVWVPSCWEARQYGRQSIEIEVAG